MLMPMNLVLHLFSCASPPPPLPHVLPVKEAAISISPDTAVDSSWFEADASGKKLYLHVSLRVRAQGPLEVVGHPGFESVPFREEVQRSVLQTPFQHVNPCRELGKVDGCLTACRFEVPCFVGPQFQGTCRIHPPSCVASCRDLWVDGVYNHVVRLHVGKDGVVQRAEMLWSETANSKLTGEILQKYVLESMKRCLFKPGHRPDGTGQAFLVYLWPGVRVQHHEIAETDCRLFKSFRHMRIPERYQTRSLVDY